MFDFDLGKVQTNINDTQFTTLINAIRSGGGGGGSSDAYDIFYKDTTVGDALDNIDTLKKGIYFGNVMSSELVPEFECNGIILCTMHNGYAEFEITQVVKTRATTTTAHNCGISLDLLEERCAAILDGKTLTYDSVNFGSCEVINYSGTHSTTFFDGVNRFGSMCIRNSSDPRHIRLGYRGLSGNSSLAVGYWGNNVGNMILAHFTVNLVEGV